MRSAAFIAPLLCLAAGCSGPQSALDPAGPAAQQIADLWTWMAVGTAVVCVVVYALALLAASGRVPALTVPRAESWIVIGGAVIPTLILAVLLYFGLAMLPPLLARAPEGSLRIRVEGEQWWWRVYYPRPDGNGTVELANEIRLPVGEPVEFLLESRDVIHSFWIPSLGGKMDMIPGRRTRLVLQATRTGTFRGVCAEYCGASHALMAFPVVVEEPDAFRRWLARQAEPAAPPAPAEAVGGALFLAHGCSACHTVRGTPADGQVGPELTHVGSRLSLGAGILPNDPLAFYNWITRTDHLKPAVLMPHFRMLPEPDRHALAAYLESLQ